MKTPLFLALVAILSLTGCAHNVRKAQPYTAPSFGRVSAPLAAAHSAIKESQKKAVELQKHVDTAGLPIWAEMTKKLEEANKSAAETASAVAPLQEAVKTVTEAANFQLARADKEEAAKEVERAARIENGRERDFFIILACILAAYLGSSLLLPAARKLIVWVSACGPYGATVAGALTVALPVALPICIGAATFIACRALLAVGYHIVFK